MKAWGTVLPGGGEKGEPDLELKEQRSPDIGQVWLRCGELLPGHHRVTSKSPNALLGCSLATLRSCAAPIFASAEFADNCLEGATVAFGASLSGPPLRL